MTSATTIDRSIALWSFGWLPPDELPGVAAEALEHGFDSPLMIDMAAADKDGGDRLHHLFEQAIAEHGRSRLTKVEAGRVIARHFAERICQGNILPIDGARMIWKISLECEQLGDQLGIFGGRVSEYEGWPDGKERVGELIVSAAREFLANASR